MYREGEAFYFLSQMILRMALNPSNYLLKNSKAVKKHLYFAHLHILKSLRGAVYVTSRKKPALRCLWENLHSSLILASTTTVGLPAASVCLRQGKHKSYIPENSE